MKSAIAIAAIAGLATVATAGATLNVHVSFDATSIFEGESATATMMADFAVDTGNGYITAVGVDVNGSSNAAAASGLGFGSWHQDGTSNPAAGPTGAASGSGIAGLGMAQSSFVDDVDSSSPIMIASWTVTWAADGTLTYSVAATGGDAFAVIDADEGFFGTVYRFDSSVFTSDTLILKTPAPSAMALLGLGGLVAGRRRR